MKMSYEEKNGVRKDLDIIDFIVNFIILSSPTLAILIYTIRATREETYHDQPTITDPGHKRIRTYDRLVLFTSCVMFVFIFLINSDTLAAILNSPLWNGPNDEEVSIMFYSSLFFPQIVGGWYTFLMWTGYFFFLRFYDKNRSAIIIKINKHLKVW